MLFLCNKKKYTHSKKINDFALNFFYLIIVHSMYISVNRVIKTKKNIYIFIIYELFMRLLLEEIKESKA